jgi:hypothetical protein
MRITKKNAIVFLIFTILILLALFIFRPTQLLQEPNITPSQFLEGMPYIYLFNSSIVLIKPTSTFFIYFLGIQTIVLGLSFLKNRKYETHLWWGIAMVFWGVGALLAGTSYQGFGYQLKCSIGEYCLYTSWFELAYYYFTAVSMSCLGIAISKTVLPKKEQKFLITYSKVVLVVYVLLQLLGTIINNRFLLSYELFTIFFMPLYLIFFYYNIVKYRKQKDQLNKTLIITWLLFLVVNLSYYVYYYLGVGESLYLNYDIWFSANDVLHIALVAWMFYLQFVVKKEIPKEIA